MSFSVVRPQLWEMVPGAALYRTEVSLAADGAVVKDAESLKKGDVLTTRFAKGTATSVVA